MLTELNSAMSNADRMKILDKELVHAVEAARDASEQLALLEVEKQKRAEEHYAAEKEWQQHTNRLVQFENDLKKSQQDLKHAEQEYHQAEARYRGSKRSFDVI